MTVYVVTHKKFEYHSLPKEYKVLLVGADNKKNDCHFLTDNIGDNISYKNPTYCELTGLYWLWKHSTSSKVGMVHYRRYFVNSNSQMEVALQQMACGALKPISEEKLSNLLDNKKWIIAAPQRFDYGYTIWSQFALCHHEIDLKRTRQIIAEMYDQNYLQAFDRVMQYNYLSPYNMFYTRKEELDAYCNWLFPILFELENRVDISSYDSYQKRLFGFIAERLFNVYVEATAKEDYKYVGVLNTEQNNRMSGTKFLYRRLKSKVLRR